VADALGVAEDLGAGIPLQQETGAARVIHMDVGEEDKVYPAYPQRLQGVRQYGYGRPGAGIHKDREITGPVYPTADEATESFPGQIEIDEEQILSAFMDCHGYTPFAPRTGAMICVAGKYGAASAQAAAHSGPPRPMYSISG